MAQHLTDDAEARAIIEVNRSLKNPELRLEFGWTRESNTIFRYVVYRISLIVEDESRPSDALIVNPVMLALGLARVRSVVNRGRGLDGSARRCDSRTSLPVTPMSNDEAALLGHHALGRDPDHQPQNGRAGDLIPAVDFTLHRAARAIAELDRRRDRGLAERQLVGAHEAHAGLRNVEDLERLAFDEQRRTIVLGVVDSVETAEIHRCLQRASSLRNAAGMIVSRCAPRGLIGLEAHGRRARRRSPPDVFSEPSAAKLAHRRCSMLRGGSAFVAAS